MNLDNVARKINQRMVRLAKQLGKDSREYQKQAAAISVVFDVSDSKQIYMTSDGVIQIKRGKTNLQNKIEEMQMLSKLPTYQQVFEKEKKRMIEENPEKHYTRADVKERIKKHDDIKDYLDSHISEIYVDGAKHGAPLNKIAMNAIKILTQKHNTWNELEKAVDEMKTAIDTGQEEFNYFEPEEY